MRGFGARNPLDNVSVPPDTVQTFVLAGAAGQSIDFSSGTQRMRLTGITTAGAQLGFYANLTSTGAAIPSSGLSTTTTGINIPIFGSREFLIPGGSTGYSLIAPSSGLVVAECWKIGG